MAEPITLETAKTRLGITSTHRDAEITALIKAARQHVERYCSIALVAGDRNFPVRRLHGDVRIPVWPVNSVAQVTYQDRDGATQTFSDIDLVNVGRPAFARPSADHAWPSDAVMPAAINVSVGDWSDTNEGAVPDDLIQAMLLLVGTWFENHESDVIGKSVAELPHGVKALCHSHRLHF